MERFRAEIKPDPIPEGSNQGKSGIRGFMSDAVETLLLSLVLFLVINTVSARIRIESISMQPTLHADNFVIVNKIAYKVGSLGRGDVIVFRYPPDPEREPYIKRIIGLPGESVSVSQGTVSINGEALTEYYISDPPRYEGSWIVPDNKLFVLGDNRNSSSDSHSWGMVPVENVIGKAEVVYWPPADWKMLNGNTASAASP